MAVSPPPSTRSEELMPDVAEMEESPAQEAAAPARASSPVKRSLSPAAEPRGIFAVPKAARLEHTLRRRDPASYYNVLNPKYWDEYDTDKSSGDDTDLSLHSTRLHIRGSESHLRRMHDEGETDSVAALRCEWALLGGQRSLGRKLARRARMAAAANPPAPPPEPALAPSPAAAEEEAPVDVDELIQHVATLHIAPPARAGSPRVVLRADTSWRRAHLCCDRRP